MASARHRLLSRYLEAANTIAADWPRAKTGGGNGVPRRTEDIQASDTETDVEIDATQRLLRRQAALLASAQQHRLAEGGTSQADGVDEELLERRLADVASTATGKFYAYRYDSVPYQWRCLYTDALILSTHLHVLRSLSAHGCLGSDALDRVVETLDRALIVTGGASERLGAAWIEKTMQNLEVLCEAQERQEEEEEEEEEETGEPSAKRLKTTGGTRAPAAADHARTFSTHEPHGRPAMRADKQCPRHRGWTLDRFEAYMDQESGGEPWPVVFTDLIDDWPALTDRPWNRPAYLLSKTFGGRRLVPVEVGRSYVDEGWTQDLVPFGRFLAEHVDASLSGRPVGYLAQHDLFRQVPGLRGDIAVPDFCWAAVPRHPAGGGADRAPVAAPQLNAWLGPPGTITPLHTDAYHNLLCQAVGTKYVRLYPPRATPCMRPRRPDRGVDMSNTSELDLGALEGWDGPAAAAAADADDAFRALDYRECVLRPGDALLIPIGWWHYVRSLSTSFSVSFWWN